VTAGPDSRPGCSLERPGSTLLIHGPYFLRLRPPQMTMTVYRTGFTTRPWPVELVRTLLPCLPLLLFGTGCQDIRSQPRAVVADVESASFGDIFTVTDSLDLQGTAEHPLYSTLVERGGERTFVSDHLGHRVLVFDGNRLDRVLGEKGTGPGQFQMPYGVHYDPTGFVVVNDRGNRRIQVFDSSFQFMASFHALGQSEELFVISADPEHPEWLVQGVRECQDGGICLLTLDEGHGVATVYGEWPQDGVVLFTWVATRRVDGTVYLANVLGDRVERFGRAGAPLGGFPLTSPTRIRANWPGEPESEHQIHATLERLKSVAHTRLRSINVMGSLLLLQYERRNVEEGAPYVMDVHALDGELLVRSVDTPGILRGGSDGYFFVKTSMNGTGRIVIRGVRIRDDADIAGLVP